LHHGWNTLATTLETTATITTAAITLLLLLPSSPYVTISANDKIKSEQEKTT
jgi:hypothetical protein